MMAITERPIDQPVNSPEPSNHRALEQKYFRQPEYDIELACWGADTLWSLHLPNGEGYLTGEDLGYLKNKIDEINPKKDTSREIRITFKGEAAQAITDQFSATEMTLDDKSIVECLMLGLEQKRQQKEAAVAEKFGQKVLKLFRFRRADQSEDEELAS